MARPKGIPHTKEWKEEMSKKMKGTSLEKIQSKIAELALRVEELENGI